MKKVLFLHANEEMRSIKARTRMWVLLASLYNHLYCPIKYKMTTHNKVVSAVPVSRPLPIITFDISEPVLPPSRIFKRVRQSLSCPQNIMLYGVEFCIFLGRGRGCHLYFVSPRASDVGGGGQWRPRWWWRVILDIPPHIPDIPHIPPVSWSPYIAPPTSDRTRQKVWSIIEYASARLVGWCERVQKMFCSLTF